MRVVIDTTCLISALALRSAQMTWLVSTWQDGLCLPLVSDSTRTEFVTVLQARKFKLSPVEQETILTNYLEYCEEVTAIGPCPVRCTDLGDQPFLDLALSGDAEVLITGDHALLALAGQTVFNIETAAAFRKRWFPDY